MAPKQKQSANLNHIINESIIYNIDEIDKHLMLLVTLIKSLTFIFTHLEGFEYVAILTKLYQYNYINEYIISMLSHQYMLHM